MLQPILRLPLTAFGAAGLVESARAGIAYILRGNGEPGDVAEAVGAGGARVVAEVECAAAVAAARLGQAPVPE